LPSVEVTTLPKTKTKQTLESEYEIKAHDTPMMSISKFVASVGIEIINILPARPLRKAESMALARKVRLTRESIVHDTLSV